jgi:LPS-assembly lipoprotein
VRSLSRRRLRIPSAGRARAAARDAAHVSPAGRQRVDNDSPLARKLRRALTESHVILAARPEDATAVLRLLKDEAGQRVLSVSPTGVPEEYELYHTLRFSLESGGVALFEPYETTVTRDYQFDPNDVLGKRHEAEYLQDAMVDDLVQVALRRLSLVH